MQIWIEDSCGILNDEQVLAVQKTVRFTLARFEDRVNRVVVRFTQGRFREFVESRIAVNVEGVGKVFARGSAGTALEAFNKSLQTVESKAAFRIDWRNWASADRLSTWFTLLRSRMAA